jgi:hypothetical protein
VNLVLARPRRPVADAYDQAAGTVQGEIWLDGTELVKLSEGDALDATEPKTYMPQGAMNSLNR